MSPSNSPTLTAAAKLGPEYVQDQVQQFQQLNTMLQMQRCRAYNDAAQVIATGAFVPLTFNTNVFDISTPIGIHSVTTNPTRFTAQANGYYQISGQVAYDADITGTFRLLRAYKNGVDLSPIVQVSQAPVLGGVNGVTIQIVASIQLVYLDYIEFIVRHDGAGNIPTIANFAWGSLTLLSRL